MNKEEIASFITDKTGKPIAVFSKDMLINHLRTDAPRIEASFDKLHSTDTNECSRLISDSAAILMGGLKASHSVGDDLRMTCGRLLINALTSCMAAFQSMRSGYRLQPGILVRNITENVATSLHLLTKPSDLPIFRAEKLKSTRAVGTAKNVHPTIGMLYGMCSERNVHIGTPYDEVQPLKEYSQGDEVLADNLWLVKVGILLVYIASELTFLDNMNSPRYWIKLSPTSGRYGLSNEEREWLSEFLGIDKELVKAGPTPK